MTPAARPWILGAVAGLVSFAFSWVPSYWADEVATVRASTLPPRELLDFTTHHVDVAHTLYYLALHVWSLAFGWSEAGTRGFSALGVGVATALIALIGARLGRMRLGALAAVVFAFMPRITWAGTEARSYAWTTALAAAVWLLLLLALERRRWWLWAALGAVAAVSVMAFLLTATLLLAQLVYVLVRGRRALVPLLITWAAALTASSPVLLLGWRERGQVAWIAGSGAFTPWTVLVEPWGESSWGYGIAVWAVLIVGAVRWRSMLRRSCPEWLLLAGVWIGVPFIVIVAVSLTSSPVFASRYLSFAMPGMAMLLAAALAALGPRGVTAAAVAGLLLVGVPSYIGQRMPYAKPGGSDLREIAGLVRAHSSPGDGIVFGPGPGRDALSGYPDDFTGLDDIALRSRFPASGSYHDKTVPLAKRLSRLKAERVVLLVVSGARSSCTGLPDARTLLANGFTAAGRYPAHSDVVCRFHAKEKAP